MSEETFEAHVGQHMNCPPCFAIKLASVQLQSPAAGDRRRSEKERNRDMAEYPILRRQGYQPKQIFGCAEVAAQAGTEFEVENHVVMAPEIRKEMTARMAEAKMDAGVK